MSQELSKTKVLDVQLNKTALDLVTYSAIGMGCFGRFGY